MVGKGSAFFAVWGYVIAKMKPSREHGALVEVNSRVVGLLLGEEEEVVRGVVDEMCEPDKESRTKEEEGRKLVRLGEYLYRVVNGAKYRAIRNDDERRESNKLRMREWRERKRKVVEVGGVSVAPRNVTTFEDRNDGGVVKADGVEGRGHDAE